MDLNHDLRITFDNYRNLGFNYAIALAQLSYEAIFKASNVLSSRLEKIKLA